MDSKKIGANQTHWKGLWPSAQFLGGAFLRLQDMVDWCRIFLTLFSGNFLCSNEKVFRNSICLELGAGTGVVGLALGKLGAKRVILTDYPSEEVLHRI